jgi:hypothetical protein
MSTQRFRHPRSRHWLAAWTAGARLGRLATVLAAAVAGLLASAAAATAAVANPIPIGDGGAVPIAPARAAVQVISTGGMAGWQIILIAAGAALAAATAAVFADRKLAGRRTVTATTA